MICQPLNPPQRLNLSPGPESSTVPHGKRGAPIGRACSGACNGRLVWFGHSYRGAAGNHGKRKRARCACGDEQAVASQRSCEGSIALGEFKIQSAGSLLPTLGKRFVCDWFGVVCERRAMDHAAIGAPQCGLAPGDRHGRVRFHLSISRSVHVSSCGAVTTKSHPGVARPPILAGCTRREKRRTRFA
jgi:hypothetical protein